MSIQCNASSFENQNNLCLIIIKRITYYKLHNFLDKSCLIYSLQLKFRQKYSTTHALIDLILKKDKNGLEKSYHGCGNASATLGKKIYFQPYAVKNKANG